MTSTRTSDESQNSPSLEVAQRHVELLTGSPDTVMHVRLIHDDPEHKRGAINRTGKLADLWPEIEARQAEGYGVFAVVNAGGHRAADIERVRAVFIDGDDIPQPTAWHAEPDFMVVRSSTRWHAYWLVTDLPPDDFRGVQLRLAERYGSDKAVNDLSRVLRLAGTLHQKPGGRPTLMELRDLTGGADTWEIGHNAADLTAGLPTLPTRENVTHLPTPTGEPISAAKYEEVLSFVDPTFEGDRSTFVGIARAILDGIVPLKAGEVAPDEGELGWKWASGDLWRERTGDESFAVPTCKYDGPEDFLADVYTGRDASAGPAIKLGTLVHLARAKGLEGPLDDTPGEVVFAEALARLAANQDESDGQASQDRRKVSRFRPIFPSEMRSLPEPAFVVDGVIPEQGVVLLYGAPASLKTFLVLDMLASTAAGIPAFGKLRTRQGATILCAGEAPFAIAKRRWPAFAEARDIASPDEVPFAVVPAVPLVSDPSQAELLIRELRASGVTPRIIAIDTVARAVGGLDENDAKAAGMMIAAAESLRDEFGCAVLLIHHSGKDESRGARGSSALAAGADAVFRVARAKDTLSVTLHCEKMKDADETPDVHLLGEAVQGSLAFRSVTADQHAAATRAKPPLSPGEVGKALQRAGAVDGQTINTRQLAVTLLPDAEEPEIASMEKKLRRGANAALAAYVAVAAEGRGTKLAWAFPTADRKAG